MATAGPKDLFDANNFRTYLDEIKNVKILLSDADDAVTVMRVFYVADLNNYIDESFLKNLQI